MQIILKSMHKRTSSVSDKLNFYDLQCDLELQPTCKNVSNGTSLPQDNTLCQIILEINA